MRVLMKTAKFADLFDGYVIKKDGEQVRKNSGDDFGLGYEYRYSTLKLFGGKCIYVYVKPKQSVKEQVEPSMCEGSIGSLKLFKVGDKVRAVATDTKMIADVVVAEEVTEIPEDLKPFFND